MSKRKDKSKKEETNKSEKFIPDNQIETYQERVLNNKKKRRYFISSSESN